MNKEQFIYSLDIGGSSVKQAIVNPYDLDSPIMERLDTIALRSRQFSDLRLSILNALNENLPRFPFVNTVAISTTGGVNDITGIVRNAGHFEDYKNVSWSRILRSNFPRLQKVYTVNDGKASAWAEYKNAGTKSNYFVHLVIGTGIGGGVIVNGSFVTGDDGQAGRLGHIKVTDERTIRCSCGSYGCVETVASAPAIEYHYAKILRLEKSNTVKFHHIAEAARRGDTAAQESVRIAGAFLGKVISTLMIIFNPSVITLGGGVVLAIGDDNNVFVDAASQSARTYAHARVRDFTVIRSASYGNDAGLIGAAQLSLLVKEQ